MNYLFVHVKNIYSHDSHHIHAFQTKNHHCADELKYGQNNLCLSVPTGAHI